MKRLFRRLLLLLFVSALGCTPAFAQEDVRHLGIGLNYGGAQIDWRSSPRWMFELRGQKGKDTSNDLETRSKVVGVRVYRFLRGIKSPSPYFGFEGAYVEAKQDVSDYRASGGSMGAFGGLGFLITPHFFLGFDIGPYFISLKEKTTKAGTSEVDFVGDTSLTYFF
jgi:hypothetical protein